MKGKDVSLGAIGILMVCASLVSADTEELKLISDGTLAAEEIEWQGEPRIGADADKFVFGGRGVRLWAKKAALGDCELNATLSFDSFTHDHRDAAVVVQDCGYLRINSGRGQLEIDHSRMPFGFKPEILGPVSDYFRGGRLFTVRMKRTGDAVSFHLDGKKLAERELSSREPMQFGFYAGLGTMRFKSWTITADKLANPVEKEYKVLFPSQTLFEGTQESYETIVGGGVAAPLIEGRGYKPGKAAVYRIPALAVTKRGTILAFAEARASGYDHGNIKTVVRRSEDGGKTWGPEIVAAGFPNKCCGNPVPVVEHETGRVFLAHNYQKPGHHIQAGYGDNSRHCYITYSDDDGKTWAKSKRITEQIKPAGWNWQATGPGKGIQLTRGKHKGRLIIPCYGRGHGYAAYSDDKGATWQKGGFSPKADILEALAVELSGGDVMLNARSGSKKRGVCVLRDGGLTLKKDSFRFDPALPDPHCQGSILRYSWPEGDKPGLILYSGPGTDQGRMLSTIRGSYDDGKTWTWSQRVYAGGSGYSDLNVLPDGRLILLFEKDGKHKLEFVTIPAPPAKPPVESAK